MYTPSFDSEDKIQEVHHWNKISLAVFGHGTKYLFSGIQKDNGIFFDCYCYYFFNYSVEFCRQLTTTKSMDWLTFVFEPAKL